MAHHGQPSLNLFARLPARVQTQTLVVLFSLAAISAWAVTPKTVTISGRVIGASGPHVIYVALWNQYGFLKKPVQRVRIEPQSPPVFRFQIPPGRWALSAFEDENGNGVLDMRVFGPKEPSGFWRPFHAWRKPRFDDVAAEIDQDTSNADIKLSGN